MDEDQSELMAVRLLQDADAAGMPDAVWQSDAGVRQAREVLGVPAGGRYTHSSAWTAGHYEHLSEAQRARFDELMGQPTSQWPAAAIQAVREYGGSMSGDAVADAVARWVRADLAFPDPPAAGGSAGPGAAARAAAGQPGAPRQSPRPPR